MRPSRYSIGVAMLSFLSRKAGAATFCHSPVAAFLSNPMATCSSHRILPFSLDANGDETYPPLPGDEQDTTRVRIWRVLASGKELSLKELGVAVGERRLGDLNAHLQHVEKQAKTLENKNREWKERRGLPTTDEKRVNRLRLKRRRGKKNEVFVRLG